MGLFEGKRPSHLGVHNGRLAPCSSKPNCVCSQYEGDAHYIEPLRYQGDAVQEFGKLKAIVRGLDRVTVIADEAHYLYAEFKSATLGFVDDVEFLLDPNGKLIHVRSASRLGTTDFGVNRKRVEAMRSQFAAQAPP